MCQKGHKACIGACQCRGGRAAARIGAVRARCGRTALLRRRMHARGKVRAAREGKRALLRRAMLCRERGGSVRGEKTGFCPSCRRGRRPVVGGSATAGKTAAARLHATARKSGEGLSREVPQEKESPARAGQGDRAGQGMQGRRFPARGGPLAGRARKKPRSQSGASVGIGPEVRRPGLIRLRWRGLQLRLRAGLLLPPRDGRKRPSPARWPRCWRAGARARDVRPGYGWGRP